MIKILHTADGHTKVREKDFASGFDKTLSEIENIIREKQIDIYVYVGDFSDTYPINDIERKILYKHLGNVLNIKTLKELVIMNGNHDLPKNKKLIDLEKENNPLDTFVNTSQYLTEELSKKVTYLKQQKEYLSICNPNISWVSYSLEDGTSNGSNLKLNPNYDKKYRIPIYHDILDEYIIDSGLPVSHNKRQYLANMDTFVLDSNIKSIIMMGDIHKNWSFNKDNKQAIYPGSNCQVNFGEGSYLKINKTPTFKKADEKIVKYYELSLDENNIYNTDYVVHDIPLQNHLNYITIDFNTKFFVEDWKDQLKILLNNVDYSNNINNIKIEFSSFYMKYEIEILNIVNEKLDSLNSQNYIIPVYGTIIFKEDNQINLETEDQLDENGNTIDLDVDDINLNSEKLSKIFSKIIDNHSLKIKSEFTNPEEYNEIITEIQTLFDEQINLVYGNKKTHNIELLSVYTSGFMALGENKINLNIPGLTRIVANNGIGKTTLFNLIRYIIKDAVIEDLPKNKTKDNNLLLFNDKLPELNKIVNILEFKINNINFSIERTVQRVWKTNATLEQKRSINWRNYIDSVTSNLKLIKFKENEDNTVLLNAEAQKYINIWFGNTPETILILNQYKILTMLNASGEKLKELILDYIGIDYLKGLENNLETVKENYNIKKPEKAPVEIITEKNNILKKIEDNNKTKIELSLKIDQNKNKVFHNNENLKKLDNELINLGNIPEKIKNTKISIENIEQELSNFKIKEIQPLPVFTLVKPDEINNSIEENNVKTLQLKAGELSKENMELLPKFNKLRLEKIEKVNENIDKLNETNENFIKTESEKLINLNKENIIQINLIKKEYIDSMEEFKNSTVELNTNLKQKTQENYNSLVLKNNILVQDINSLTNKIDKAFCSECNKPLELTQEQIEEFKNQKLLKVKEQNSLKIEIDTNSQEIENLNKIINENENNFELLKGKLKWDSTQDALIVLENELKTLQEIKCNSYLKLKPLYDDSIQNHIKILDLVKSEEYIKNNNLITQFNSLKENYILPLNNTITDLESYKKIAFIKDLIELLEKYNENFNNIKKIDDEVKIKNNEIQSSINHYNKLIKEYQEKYQKYLDDTKLINDENSKVNEHNAKQSKLITSLEIEKNNLQSFENSLENYNKFNEEKIILNEETEKINLEIKNNEISISNIDNYENLIQTTLNDLNQLEKDWKNYRFKNYIYKTFEKFIKDDFKYAIFNYYRQFLNIKLNILLEGLDFRLYWNEDSYLYLVSLSKDISGNNEMTYRPVKLASGMQSSFLGLALIYAMHLLNTKNNISHIFIDEISGQLNDGQNINSEKTDDEIIDETNYQEKLVKLLAKFDAKKVMIVDHVISELFETHTYYVVKKIINGQIVGVYK